MYFNGIPPGFGQAQIQQPNLFNQPAMGYNGGIGNLTQGNPPNPTQTAPQIQNLAPQTASTAGLGGKSITPLYPYQRPMAGQAMAKGGKVKSGISALDAKFGVDHTNEMIRRHADGGVVSGPGSGVEDLIQGSIDGREDVRIASGEYVIPAWAVAALGDGSTEAGAKVLDDMVARLREEGSEKIMGTEPINTNQFLPA